MTSDPTLELALIRWAVVCQNWSEIGGGFPSLSGFLAGWFCRVCEATRPSVNRYRDSFNCGWQEADQQISIMIQEGGCQEAATSDVDVQPLDIQDEFDAYLAEGDYNAYLVKGGQLEYSEWLEWVNARAAIPGSTPDAHDAGNIDLPKDLLSLD